MTSLRTRTVSASLMLKRLSSTTRQSGLAQALRQMGRIERTLFTLDWINDEELRKEEILRLVLDGCTNKQIAKILNISPGTVKSHIESILVKLNVNNRIKAATTYFMNGHAADNLSVVSDRNFGVE